MGNKKVRSVGKVKANRAGKNCARRAGKAGAIDTSVMDFVTQQANLRWPSQDTEQAYHELNISRRGNQGRGGKRVKPPEFFFPLLEQAIGAEGEEHKMKTVRHLLLCASLEIKSVRRYPGYILKKVYSHKNRPLNFSR